MMTVGDVSVGSFISAGVSVGAIILSIITFLTKKWMDTVDRNHHKLEDIMCAELKSIHAQLNDIERAKVQYTLQLDVVKDSVAQLVSRSDAAEVRRADLAAQVDELKKLLISSQ